MVNDRRILMAGLLALAMLSLFYFTVRNYSTSRFSVGELVDNNDNKCPENMIPLDKNEILVNPIEPSGASSSH